jgi:hypothetical protein
MNRCCRTILWIVLIATSVASLGAAPLSRQEWLALDTEYFSILYTVGDYPLAFALQNETGPTLDRLFTQFNVLFGVDLAPPLTIRIYPDFSVYTRLNVVAPSVPADGTHSRIGRREIALFSDRIFDQQTTWDQESLNGLYYELAVLFAIDASQNQAPPGLLTSIGAYARDPFLVSMAGLADLSVAEVDWLDLWMDPDLRLSREGTFLGASMVAYLVDARGWEAFVRFLAALPEGQDIQEVITLHYDLTPSALEARWKDYWPLYLASRWAVNFFHTYDLARYETLLEAGAYQEAALGLEQAVDHLTYLEQPETLDEARRLLARAQTGQHAGELLLSAREAILAGEYSQALEALNAAEDLYSALGDPSRQEDVDALREHAKTVLALRVEIADLQALDSGLFSDYGSRIARLDAVAAALEDLGDGSGQSSALELKESLLMKRQRRRWALAGGGFFLALVLSGGVLFLTRHKDRQEGVL